MKIIRKIISVLLVFTMVFSTFCLSVFANDNVEVSYIKVPQAKFTSSGVVRVAKSVNSFEHGNTIVAATPSGVPKIDNSAIANTAYAGETASYTRVTLTLDVVPETEPVVYCDNITLSLVSASDKTFVWDITGGSATAGSTIDISAVYNYEGNSYISHCYVYVMSIETGSSYAISYHCVNNLATTHAYYAANTVNSRILGTNVVYKNTSKGNGYFDYITGKPVLAEDDSYTASMFVDRAIKTDLGSNSQQSLFLGNTSNKAVANIYFDTSLQNTFADANIRHSINTGTNYDPADSTANSSYFNANLSATSLIFEKGLVNSSVTEGDSKISSKLGYSLNLTLNSNTIPTNTLGINSSMSGKVSDFAEGESYTITSVFTSENTDSWYYNISNTLYSPVYFLIHKYDKSELRNAIDYVLNTPVDDIEITKTTGKGINPQEWYYSSGYSEFEAALKNANKVNQKIDVTQEEIDNAVSLLKTAYSNLVLAKADYVTTQALLKVADVYYENHPSYLEEQFQVLVKKVDNVNMNCHLFAQPTLDAMNDELLVALDDMKLVPADYSELKQALAQKPEYDEKYYTESSYNEWEVLATEAQMIVDNELISYYDQTLVHNKAVALLEKLEALEIKPADLTQLKTALELTPYEASLYKDEALYNQWESKFEEASEYAKREDLDVFNNEEIESLADELTQAYNALELKDADIKALETAVNSKNKVVESECNAEDYAAFIEAVEKGEAMLQRDDLTILDNDEISALTKKITDAFLALEITEADKTSLETALALTPEYDADKYVVELYKDYSEKLKVAQNLFDDVTLVAGDNEAIALAVEELTQAFNALKLQDADMTALEEALKLLPTHAEEEYSISSYSAYKDAYEEGKLLSERTDLTILDNEEISEVAQKITDAYNSLDRLSYSFEVKEGSTAIVDEEKGFIYGIEEGTDDLEKYFDMDNCTLEYSKDEIGTGLKVELKQKDRVLATYYLVIFGDVTGDGIIDAFDVALLSSVANYEFDFEENSAESFAGDLNCDGFIDSFDVTILISAANLETTISQTR